MSEYAAPGGSFTARTYDWPTGLAGTIGVAILDQATRAVVTARATAGITEDTTGVYKVTLTAPSTAGEYLLYWTDAVSPTITAEEELVVSGPGVPTAPALVTLTQVREYLQKPSGDTLQDTMIEALIVRASHLILDYAGREFVLADGGSNPRTRVVEVGGYWRTRVIPVGDMASLPTAVVVQDQDAETVATLTVGTDIEARPLVRRAWEPVTHIFLRSSAGAVDPTYRLSVTGTFGFPSVPADVQQACIITVGTWLRRDVSAFSQTFALDEARIERPQALPQAAMRMLDPWRYPGVA